MTQASAADQLTVWQAEARAALEAGAFQRVQELCRAILSQAPEHPAALQLAGLAAQQQGRHEEALGWLDRAVAAAEGNGILRFTRAGILRKLGRLQEALWEYQRAVALVPQFQPAWTNLTAVLQDLERYEEALPAAQRAVELDPQCPIAQYNLGHAYAELGEPWRAIEHYERAAALAPDHLVARWNLAVCRLLTGDFERGWPDFELRVAASQVHHDLYPQPRWQGEPLEGKTLLVHPEQGIGDEILFASCLEDAIRCAERVVLVCEPRLATLFARSFPTAGVYAWQRRNDYLPPNLPERIDVQVPAGSLPLHFRRRRDAFPRRARYLVPDPRQVEHWRQQLARLGPGPYVGLSWLAGGKPAESRRRSIALVRWREVLGLPGLCFINLQYGDATPDLEAVRSLGYVVHDLPEVDPLVDLDGFAALLAALDLVVSVGNATVHLAGAVGVPTLALLPVAPSWRWLQEGSECLWYRSVELLRQARGEPWEAVLSRAAGAVCERLRLSKQQATGVRAASVEIAGKLHGQLLGAHFRPEGGRAEELSTRTYPLPGSANNGGDPQPAAAQAGTNGAVSAPQAPHQEACLHKPPVDADVQRWLTALEVPSEQAVGEAMAAAIGWHRQAEFERAEAVYRAVLRIAPRHPDALHLLGVLLRQTGRVQAAVASLRRAAAIAPQAAVIHYNLGSALLDAGRLEEAAESFHLALRLEDGLIEAYINLGAVYRLQGKLDDSLAMLQRACAQDPNRVECWLNLGQTLRAAGQAEDAERCLRRALELAPMHVPTLEELGAFLIEQGRPAEACSYLDAALRCVPNRPAAWNHKAMALRAMDRLDEALACGRRARELAPHSFEILANLAGLYDSAGQLAEAVACYQQALKQRPRAPEVLANLGFALARLGQDAEALACYDQALDIWPDYPLAHANRAMTLLQLGRYREGWEEYEWRWKCQHSALPRARLTAPLWQGEPLDNKTLLVHGEQGLGDEIMFATCYPDVIAAARHVVIACDPRLRAIFARSFPSSTVLAIPRGSEHEWSGPREPAIDVQIPAGSLPRFLRPSWESFPRQHRLLHADPRRLHVWQQRLCALGPGLKVGIGWRGGWKAVDRKLRSTALEDWRPILSVPGVHYVCLQYDATPDEVADLSERLGVPIHWWPDLNPMREVDGWAALIAALDLVVSVGNAGVHLAGALGVPTWNLLPHRGGWRWPLHGQDSGWYASVLLFRQPAPGDWRGLFVRVGEELLKLSARWADPRAKRQSMWCVDENSALVG
ncbi:MAG: tetratricopeptide repeat protein [Pirellulales bacterium]|nr:tetratricopeptide repeat protein [Pirellulales bacterium]